MKSLFIYNKLPDWASDRLMPLGIGLVLLLSSAACSDQAAPTAPADSPSLDPEDVQALIGEAVQEAVKAAITESATGSGGKSYGI